MLSQPSSFTDVIKSKFLAILFDQLEVRSVAMVTQTMLSLYSYNATTGVVLDVGEKIEVLPVVNGYVVEGGVMRLPLGGQRLCEVMNSYLINRKVRFASNAEFLLARYAVEKLCFVSMDYTDDHEQCLESSQDFKSTVPLLGPLTSDLGRFKSPEGFFNPEIWGVDNDSVQKLVLRSIGQCPIDSRRQMWRNIYLTGGVTMLPNFKERLQLELNRLTPDNVVVQVHASWFRYHSSYVGACVLANLESFQRSCVNREEWMSLGDGCLKKMSGY
ncbi:hypothetical protein HELRODRAFT_75228 [Helobdella robusta]|uniref:Uncharacterized protein n=1 Tax=Helobdella robusta TaxID=6412 RepID=T1G228_HELRO|nr:hypothetical protein HELRODRAFT_75228 [Helobdella robusta]ESO08191.1 hypothetical protein HELRODRAFT_75228 [Helobdella robusta]